MRNWEYLTIQIRYDGKRHKNWVLTYADRPPLVGLQAILQAHGVQGWELVSLDVEHREASPGFGKWYVDPTVYRATFKRPVETGDR